MWCAPRVQLTADGDNSTLDCPTAIAWLEHCGVLGHAAVRAPAPPGFEATGQAARTVPSVLSLDEATDAFVEALPAVACLGKAILDEGEAAAQLTSLRHFQEWLARCGEVKYAELTHLSLAERTAGFLQNVFERRTTEAVVVEALMPPPAPRFDAAGWVPPEEMPPSELSLLLGAWEVIDLAALPGFPTWEQPVFELLAQCVSPLTGIFAFYARSSLEHERPEQMGYVELDGWNEFVDDCNAVTKSFSAQRAAEVLRPARLIRALLCRLRAPAPMAGTRADTRTQAAGSLRRNGSPTVPAALC